MNKLIKPILILSLTFFMMAITYMLFSIDNKNHENEYFGDGYIVKIDDKMGVYFDYETTSKTLTFSNVTNKQLTINVYLVKENKFINEKNPALDFSKTRYKFLEESFKTISITNSFKQNIGTVVLKKNETQEHKIEIQYDIKNQKHTQHIRLSFE